MRVLVLGGYGFIGAEILRALHRRGHEAIGLGRDAALGARLVPGIGWIGADIARLAAPEDWMAALDGVEAVVNASGALQSGARDNLAALQDRAIRACIAAAGAAGVKRFVQISAPGAAADSPGEFLRTKARADAALAASALDWIVLRPGLVIGRNAYGGTALLRLLAGFPLIQPLALADARIQTVAMDDVVAAVVAAVEGKVTMRAGYDLMEAESHSLEEVVSKLRRWMGFGAAPPVRAPRGVALFLARLADLAGWLGWRSPLRTNALRALEAGVVGDGSAWRDATGRELSALDETLAAHPATAQDRVYARAQLLIPVLVVTLAAFWIASGVIGLVQREAAAAHLGGVLPAAGAMTAVIAGGALDILVGAALLWGPWAKRAALAGAALASAYLAAGSLLAPQLWLDPLGVYVKIVPAIVLSLTLALLLQER